MGGLSNVKHKVKLLVQHCPMLCGNYNALCLNYWIVFDGAESLLDIMEVTPAETITRTFRNLVRTGEIRVSGALLEQRKELEKEMKEYFAGGGE